MFRKRGQRYYDWVVNRDLRAKQKQRAKQVDHTETDFEEGIFYKAKLIGFKDIQRPKDRIGIVAAMREIRFEFKNKNVKKQQVTIGVGVDGIRVSFPKNNSKLPMNATNKNNSLKTTNLSEHLDAGTNTNINNNKPLNNTDITLMHDQINRIFYVSHDSQDLQVWSYIAQDANSSSFKCCVFKSFKKSDAVRIVHTIGQAFDICHKITQKRKILESSESSSPRTPKSPENDEANVEDAGSEVHPANLPENAENYGKNDTKHTKNAQNEPESNRNRCKTLNSPESNQNIKNPDSHSNSKNNSTPVPVLPSTQIFDSYLTEINSMETHQIRIERGYMQRCVETEQARADVAQQNLKKSLDQNKSLVDHLKNLHAYISSLECLVQTNVGNSFEVLEKLRVEHETDRLLDAAVKPIHPGNPGDVIMSVGQHELQKSKSTTNKTKRNLSPSQHNSPSKFDSSFMDESFNLIEAAEKQLLKTASVSQIKIPNFANFNSPEAVELLPSPIVIEPIVKLKQKSQTNPFIDSYAAKSPETVCDTAFARPVPVNLQETVPRLVPKPPTPPSKYSVLRDIEPAEVDQFSPAVSHRKPNLFNETDMPLVKKFLFNDNSSSLLPNSNARPSSVEQVADQLVTEIVAAGNSVSSSFYHANSNFSDGTTSFDPSAMIDELNKNVQMLSELEN